MHHPAPALENACGRDAPLVRALLRGHMPARPITVARPEAFLSWTQRHGLDGLLDAAGAAAAWPEPIARVLRERALAWAAWDLRHTSFLASALTALAAAGIDVLVFKGTAIAWRDYASPHLRPRADTDLMVRPTDRQAAARVLESIGLTRMGDVANELASYECSFCMKEAGLTHVLDLHWRFHYSQLQSQRLPFADLLKRSEALPALGGVRIPCATDAFILNCVHRSNDMRIPQWTEAGASFGEERLIALHDVFLLLGRMPEEELAALPGAIRAAGALSPCREALRLTAHWFGSAQAARVDAELTASDQGDAIRRYQDALPWRQRWMDFTALGGIASRWQYVSEHLAPDAAGLRRRYRDEQSPVAVLQMRRLADGVVRWSRSGTRP